MKKLFPSPRKLIPAIVLLTLALLIQIIPALAVTTFSIDPSTIPSFADGALSGDRQLLFVNNGKIDSVPNSAVVMVSGVPVVNIGDQVTYPNPNGRINFYKESTTSEPILGISSMGSSTNYVQGLFIQNFAKGGNASSDVIIANDLGSATSSSNYLDLGVANTGQSDPGHTAIGALDGYLYNQGTSTPIGIIFGQMTKMISLSVGMNSTSSTFSLDQYAHLITKGSSSGALSGCGTSPSTVGNDNNGVITTGAGLSVTACIKTFANPYPVGSTVACSISTNSTLIQPALTSVSTTGFSVGLSLSLAGGKIYYQCMASS